MRAAVAAGHAVTARAAARVLERGGNAVDAIVAAGAMSWAAEPGLTGPCGGGFLMVRPGADGARPRPRRLHRDPGPASCPPTAGSARSSGCSCRSTSRRRRSSTSARRPARCPGVARRGSTPCTAVRVGAVARPPRAGRRGRRRAAWRARAGSTPCSSRSAGSCEFTAEVSAVFWPGRARWSARASRFASPTWPTTIERLAERPTTSTRASWRGRWSTTSTRRRAR